MLHVVVYNLIGDREIRKTFNNTDDKNEIKRYVKNVHNSILEENIKTYNLKSVTIIDENNKDVWSKIMV